MSEAADRVADLVELVVDALGLDATVTVVEMGDELIATVEGEDLGLFIGRHGQTIEAIQHLAQRVGRAEAPEGETPQRVVVDADGYRERRREALEEQADSAANEALSAERSIPLPAMNAAERRIVHERLRDRTDVTTHSEGDERERHVVVVPDER